MQGALPAPAVHASEQCTIPHQQLDQPVQLILPCSKFIESQRWQHAAGSLAQPPYSWHAGQRAVVTHCMCDTEQHQGQKGRDSTSHAQCQA